MAGCQAGAERVHNEILGHWPAQTYNAGCYNPLSKLDSGAPSPHAKGEAIDIGIEPPYRGRNSTGQQIFRFLYDNRFRLGIHQIIYDAQIWTQGGNLHPYNSNPHRDHIHVAFVPSAARNPGLSARPLPGASSPSAPKPPPPPEDFDMPVLIKGDQSDHVYVSDGLHKRWLVTKFHVDQWLAPKPPVARLVTLAQATVDQIPLEPGTKAPPT